MKRRERVFLSAAALAVVFSLGPPAWGASGTGTMGDGINDKVSSDGRGMYVDGDDCVSVIVTNNGFYQLRTVKNTDECNAQTLQTLPPGRRFLTLDFGAGFPKDGLDLDLEPGDTDPTVEKVPARFIADKLFAQTSVTTPVRILILQVVLPDGTTTQDTAWELRYKNEANIVVNADGSRTISQAPGAAAADLFAIVQRVNRNGKVTTVAEFRGVFDMPFHVTAARK